MRELSNDDVVEDSIGKFVGMASDMGVSPENWPEPSFSTDLGNGQPFYLTRADEDVASYRQASGSITLTVFND